MTLSLHLHQLEYGISARECLAITLTGFVFGGVPYAIRHWQRANFYARDYEYETLSLKHRAIAVLLFLPALGALVALIMKIVDLCKSKESVRQIFNDEILRKMHKRGRTALEIHRNEYERKKKESGGGRQLGSTNPFVDRWNLPSLQDITFRVRELDRARESLQKDQTLAEVASTIKLSVGSAHDLGIYAKEMEDTHSSFQFSEGFFAAVFDGHGPPKEGTAESSFGTQVAKYANREFKNRFPSMLKDKENNVRKAFDTLTHQINNEVCTKWTSYGGTTAVMTYITPNGVVYTNTVGDSEANIYRNVGGQIRSTPISRVLNFVSQRVHEKAEQIMGHKLGRGSGGIGISIGDASMCLSTCISQTTVTNLQIGDILVLRSDGAINFVDETETIEVISKNFREDAKEIAEALTRKSVKNQQEREKNGKGDADNVTNLVIKVGASVGKI